jgi:hypothetical protein
MKSLFTAFFLLLVAGTAAADWANGLTTLPPAGTKVPTAPSTRNGDATFFFIPAESTTDSSWLMTPMGYETDVCLDSDTTSATAGAGSLTVQVLYLPYTDDGCPADQDDSLAQGIMLGATLDGLGRASGTPNDCVRAIDGAHCININVSAASAAGDTGLVSVTTRQR